MSMWIRGLALAVGALVGLEARAATGTFSTLTYNVAGLPQGLSSAVGDRQSATRLISCYVKAFDVVNVQEDFNYHAALYDACDDHPYRTPTTGGAGIGSGLNTLSRFPFDDFDRVKWSACNGTDCLTPKGFTVARVRLAPGVFVDVYNVHTNAGDADADLAARRANVLQLLGYIESYSAGRAVIVMGDTNTRYTRSGDNMWEALRRGLGDAWIELVRGGAVPASGAATLGCSPATTAADCEVVDRVLYRDNGYVGLKALTYAIRADALDGAGQELSDHRPIAVTWSYSTAADRRLSDTWGGPHGAAFDDVASLPAAPAAAVVSLRAGNRVDQVELTLSSGYVLSHGGGGGAVSSLVLARDEYLSSLDLCAGKYNGTTRVFHAKFTTTAGRTLAGGTTTSSCTTYAAPAGWQIVGFHGRAAAEVDRLGVIYAPIVAKPGSTSFYQLVNRNSGQCLDVTGAATSDGTNIEQWPCNGGDQQRWSYDPASGLIRSQRDPRFCLDNGGTFGDGANVILWTCTGSAHQRFTIDSGTGAVAVRTYPSQVLDVANVSTAAGANVGTWSWWGGGGQRWDLVP